MRRQQWKNNGNIGENRGVAADESLRQERSCERIVFRHGAILLIVRECSFFNPQVRNEGGKSSFRVIDGSVISRFRSWNLNVKSTKAESYAER